MSILNDVHNKIKVDGDFSLDFRFKVEENCIKIIKNNVLLYVINPNSKVKYENGSLICYNSNIEVYDRASLIAYDSSVVAYGDSTIELKGISTLEDKRNLCFKPIKVVDESLFNSTMDLILPENLILSKLQLDLKDEQLIQNKPTVISWKTGSGKSLGALLQAQKIQNESNVPIIITTHSQPLTISWGKELNKYNLLSSFEVRCTLINESLSDNLTNSLAKRIVNSEGINKVRIIDYLSNILKDIRQMSSNELPILVFDEYDSYNNQAKKLIAYYKRVYTAKKVAHKLIYVSATGDDSNLKLQLVKYEENDNVTSILIPDKNIRVVNYFSEDKYFKNLDYEDCFNSYTGYYDSIMQRKCSLSNAFFETYLHLDGVHGEISHIVDMFGVRDHDSSIYKTVTSSDDSETFLDNICTLIEADVVENTFIQSHLGAGVDFNMSSCYIDILQFERFRDNYEFQRDFIQRMGRINRNNQSNEALVYVNCDLEYLYNLLNGDYEPTETVESLNTSVIDCLISGVDYKIRPYVIPFKISTPNGEKRYAYYTYDERIYNEFRNSDEHYASFDWHFSTLSGIRKEIERYVFINYSRYKVKMWKLLDSRRETMLKGIMMRLDDTRSLVGAELCDYDLNKALLSFKDESYSSISRLYSLHDEEFYSLVANEVLRRFNRFQHIEDRMCNNQYFSSSNLTIVSNLLDSLYMTRCVSLKEVILVLQLDVESLDEIFPEPSANLLRLTYSKEELDSVFKANSELHELLRVKNIEIRRLGDMYSNSSYDIQACNEGILISYKGALHYRVYSNSVIELWENKIDLYFASVVDIYNGVEVKVVNSAIANIYNENDDVYIVYGGNTSVNLYKGRVRFNPKPTDKGVLNIYGGELAISFKTPIKVNYLGGGLNA